MDDERENESAGAGRSGSPGAGQSESPGVEQSETAGTVDGAEVKTDLDLGAVLRVLDHPRRRHLVTTLVNGRSEAPLRELSAEIAAKEHDKTVGDVTEPERDRVHTSLHHSHVPRLAALGIVTYDSNDESVVRAANADRVRAVLHSAGVALNDPSNHETASDGGDPSDEEAGEWPPGSE